MLNGIGVLQLYFQQCLLQIFAHYINISICCHDPINLGLQIHCKPLDLAVPHHSSLLRHTPCRRFLLNSSFLDLSVQGVAFQNYRGFCFISRMVKNLRQRNAPVDHLHFHRLVLKKNLLNCTTGHSKSLWNCVLGMVPITITHD